MGFCISGWVDNQLWCLPQMCLAILSELTGFGVPCLWLSCYPPLILTTNVSAHPTRKEWIQFLIALAGLIPYSDTYHKCVWPSCWSREDTRTHILGQVDNQLWYLPQMCLAILPEQRGYAGPYLGLGWCQHQHWDQSLGQDRSWNKKLLLTFNFFLSISQICFQNYECNFRTPFSFLFSNKFITLWMKKFDDDKFDKK